jgi:hypothetical protein
MSNSHAPRLPHSSPIPIFRKECRLDRLIGIWTPTVRRSFDPVSGALKLAALGSTVVNLLSPGQASPVRVNWFRNLTLSIHLVEQSLALLIVTRTPPSIPALLNGSGRCWPLKSGAASTPAATWADRRGPNSSHPFPGGRPSPPMSPHGKRPWPGAARRDETLELVLWSRWIVCGGVGKTTETGGYTQAAPSACMLFVVVSVRSSLRNERESAASAPHGHPAHFIPRLQLTSQESPPGERGLSGCLRKCQRMIRPHPPCCHALGTLDFQPPFCMRIPSSRLRRPPRTAPGQHNTPDASCVLKQHHEVRPGALTRPRRLRPTSGETPKTPPCLRHGTFPPFLGPVYGLWLGDDSTVFLRMSFVRAAPALPSFRPVFGQGWRWKRKQKLVHVGSAIHTERPWLGWGCRLLGFATLAADFWRDLHRRRPAFDYGFDVAEDGGIFVRDRWGWGSVRLAV